MKKLKDLWDCHGRYFRCKIANKECEGRICIEDGEIYLCQDIVNGTDSEEKFGYDYSWQSTLYAENILKDSPNNGCVSEFILLDNDSIGAPLATLSDLKVGNVIKYRHLLRILYLHILRHLFYTGNIFHDNPISLLIFS